jgi:two-component system, OmpR family, sensor histidine kinase KdpD
LLGISVLLSALLGRTRERAVAAESRGAELRALQELSSELVGRVPGKEAYESVLSRLSSLLGFDAVSLLVQDEDSSRGFRQEVSIGADVGSLDARSAVPSDGRQIERLPLSVGRHNLGMLLLRSAREPLTPGESRVLRAFCDQLALVLERDRLLHVAAKAESYRVTEKLRRALLTAVSHDLRSPLSAIKASVTDLLDEEAPDDPAYRSEALTSIDKEVDRLNLLIANLLDMSRIESGMLRARVQGVDLQEVIGQSLEQARRRWSSVHFAVSAGANGAVVRADPVFLDRVITNLLDNAARASTEAGKMDVELETRAGEEGAIVVRIIDHGKGVPNAMREHLFHPFYDLDERGARLGAGLGLAICKGFLTSMQGNIWIEQTPGGGATLAFSLETEKAA